MLLTGRATGAVLAGTPKAKPFLHGEDTRSVASIILDPVLLAQAVDYDMGDVEPQYELLSDEEMEDYFKNKQEENA